MLYTGKGDDGTTKTFDCPSGKRISKDDPRVEALGALDELNSFLGMCKVEAEERGFALKQHGTCSEVIHGVQNTLFSVQAEVAGAPKTVSEEKTEHLESVIGDIEKELPPITTFFISGGSELASRLDVARTLARRAERRIVSLNASGTFTVTEHTRAYLNRLSSLLYALARLSNHISGIKEKPPQYE